MSDQIRMLIDSMQRLLSLLSSNKQNQTQIYKTLTKDDLLRIITKIDDDNPTLRKMSIKLICELLYQNNQLKQQFGALMNIRPINGHYQIKYRKSLLKDQIDCQIMTLLKSSKEIFPTSSKSLCWYIDPTEAELSIGLIKLEDQVIKDPRDYLIGITTVLESNPLKAIHESVVLELRSNLKQHRSRASVPYTNTERHSEGIRQMRSKREQNINVSHDQYKLYPKPTTRKVEDRVKTDDFDQFKPRASKGGISASPQPSNLKVIDRNLKDKKNEKSGVTLSQSGNTTDRSVKNSQFHSKTKISNNFVSEIRNTFLAAKDIGSSKKGKQKSEILSHRQSFDGNYKPSEVFLRRFRNNNAETDRRLY